MFSYLTCLYPNTLKLLNIFSQIETISLKIWETIVLACEMFTSDFHLTLRNVACLSFISGYHVRETNSVELFSHPAANLLSLKFPAFSI